MSTFQSVFKDLRVRGRFTQQELAEKLEVSQSTITMWENGKRQPDIETLEVIADFFNVDMNFLTGVSGNTTRILDAAQLELLELYGRLNQNGRDKLIEYAADLVSSNNYLKKTDTGIA